MIERRWLGAIAGRIGPLLFVATFTIAGWLRPGYRAREMFVSELSLGSRGWIQIANFIVEWRRSARVRRHLSGLDLHVCVEAWLDPGRWSGRETGSPSLLADIAVA
jgi:Protein of unknown function (DUF998)